MISNLKLKENLYTSLIELSLTESEANLYEMSLAIGPSTIASLAEYLGMPRPNVYKVIAGLERHGLAKFSERKQYTRTFVVESPTVVLQKLREKREVVANLDHALVGFMPELLAQYRQGETPTKIKVFEGKEQWLKIFFQVLDEAKGNISFFGSADSFIELITWEKEYEWIEKRIKKNIHINVLLTPSKDADVLGRSERKEMRTTRIYTGSLPFVTGFMVYANKVIIWQPKAPLVLLIEDQFIVEMLHSIFDFMWCTTQKEEKEV